MQRPTTQPSIDEFYAQGKARLKQGFYEEALGIFNEIARAVPNHAAVHYQRGQALLGMGDVRMALTAYRDSLKHAPNHPDTLNAIANAYYTLGERDKAVSHYEKSFALHPANPYLLFNLVHMHQYALSDAPVKQLFALHKSNLPAAEKAAVCFALGEVYEKLGKLEDAFPYFEEGNAAARLTFPHYDPAKELALMDSIEATFTPEFFQAQKEVGNPDATPIFVIGMQRSGTTLIEQILASHPKVHGAGELTAMSVIAFRDIPNFPQGANQLSGGQFQQLAGHYLQELRRHAPKDVAHICDKLPTNFLLVGLIHTLFPKARIAHIQRDPMDTCWSLYKHFFIDRNPYCYDQATLGRFYVRYHRLMQHWHKALPGVVHDVRYETLLEKPEETIRALLNYCGLEWEKQCLSFHHTKRNVATASALQVRKPLYKTSLKAWAPVEKYLSPLKEALRAGGL